MKATFDPLVCFGLPPPQYTDVSTLQNHDRPGVGRQIGPNLASLLSLKEAFVGFDLDEFSGVELLPYLVKNGFGQTRFSKPNAGLEFTRSCFFENVLRNVSHSTTPLSAGGALGHHRSGVQSRKAGKS
jgi:hypothetical protein